MMHLLRPGGPGGELHAQRDGGVQLERLQLQLRSESGGRRARPVPGNFYTLPRGTESGGEGWQLQLEA